MEPDRGHDRDQVDVVAFQEVVDVGDRCRDAEALGGSCRTVEHGIADGAHDDPVGDVCLGHVREDRAERERANTDDPEPQRLIHRLPPP